ncbi:TrkA C-terminal domain-containing protein [Thermosediminibacter oceani]|uniref:TrkA-C domain protein n=1 Tax=Thermosediminibacter oceani (strain ATCC BAA-1034 / DSM 16646 / JW/IW-1228P) TaxID=555079 RepID=D9S0P0_THEOJ|nr:TrkA C-terminal domain-containing protein [Thermosediminibacter oceani]ADL08898.1 TrkA-C domain protein [Thermosediminibacter oceani DSM 16646]
MNEVVRPRYEYIALDIARRIVQGEFSEGEKLYGRSNLAGLYNVSPETIRRAVSLLEDMGVVSSEQGRGIIVKSREAAYKYVDRFNEKQTLESLRNELTELLEARRRLDERFELILLKTIEYANRLRNINAFNPAEVRVNEESRAVGKTISELKFWENTGATIIAVRRGEELFLSPGPHFQIKGGDFLVLVGDEDVLKKTDEFLNTP